MADLVEDSAGSAAAVVALAAVVQVEAGDRSPTIYLKNMSNTRINRLLRFFEEDPNDPFVRFALASEYLKIGQVKRALEWFEKLASDRPDYVGTYYHLGKLYSKLGRTTDARETFDRGIETASAIHDFHAISELRSAKMELEESSDELV